MNKLLLVLMVLLFQSCIEKKVENKNLDTVSIDEKKDLNSSKKIPAIDYETLAPLLNKKNDTTYVVNFWAT